MIDVKPDEISAILKQQLSGFSTATELEEVGTVLQVGDGIARVYGLNKAQAGELVEFETGVKAVVLNLEEDNVGVVLMGPGDHIRKKWLAGLSTPLVSPLMVKALLAVRSTKCHWSVKLLVLSTASQ